MYAEGRTVVRTEFKLVRAGKSLCEGLRWGNGMILHVQAYHERKKILEWFGKPELDRGHGIGF